MTPQCIIYINLTAVYCLPHVLSQRPLWGTKQKKQDKIHPCLFLWSQVWTAGGKTTQHRYSDTVESHTVLHLHASQSETWWMQCLRKKKKILPSRWQYSDQPLRSALRPAGGYLLMRRWPLTISSAIDSHWWHAWIGFCSSGIKEWTKAGVVLRYVKKGDGLFW